MTAAEITDALARIEVAHDALGLRGEIPRRIVDHNGGVCPILVRWANANGVSLDWIICGDVTLMIRATSRWRKHAA